MCKIAAYTCYYFSHTHTHKHTHTHTHTHIYICIYIVSSGKIAALYIGKYLYRTCA